jgi:hypothetical protein
MKIINLLVIPSVFSTFINFILSIHQWHTALCWAPVSSFVIFFRHGRTYWRSDQPVARPLPTHRTTQTQNKRPHKHPMPLSGIRTHDPSVRASHCDRHFLLLGPDIFLSTSFRTPAVPCSSLGARVHVEQQVTLHVRVVKLHVSR